MLSFIDHTRVRLTDYSRRKTGRRSDPCSGQRPHHRIWHIYREYVRCGGLTGGWYPPLHWETIDFRCRGGYEPPGFCAKKGDILVRKGVLQKKFENSNIFAPPKERTFMWIAQNRSKITRLVTRKKGFWRTKKAVLCATDGQAFSSDRKSLIFC